MRARLVSLVLRSGLSSIFLVAVLGIGLQTPVAMAAEPVPLLIRAGDGLDFDILDDPDPAIKMVVAQDGNLLLPLVGEVPVAGLTIPAAKRRIEAFYKDAALYKEPRIALAVATYGDVYVIGAVRNPGAYSFHPQMSVEQAIALAGGLASGPGGPLDPFQAERLEGELQGVTEDIVAAALQSARLQARIDGSSAIRGEDVPAAFRDVAALPAYASLKESEDRVLVAQVEGFATQVTAHEAAIAAATRELDLLGQRLENQSRAVDYSRQQLERTRSLVERGLRVAMDASDAQRQLVSEEGLYLSILTQISQSQSRKSAQESNLTSLQSQYRESALTDLHAQSVALTKLASQRRTLLGLVAGGRAGLGLAAAAPTYAVRRGVGQDSQMLSVEVVSLLEPHDVLTVSLEPAGAF